MAGVQTEAEFLEESRAHLRPGVHVRAITVLLNAAAFSPLVGWRVALAWYVITIFWTEAGQHGVDRLARSSGRSRRWIVLTSLHLGISAAVFGAIGVIATLKGGLWGLVVAEFQLLSLILVVTSTAGRSAIAYYVSAVPLAIYLAVLAAYSFTLSGPTPGPFLLSLGTALLIFHTHQIATANRRMARNLHEARAAAEASTAAKSAFVAIVSHELRTPLSGILAGADELSRRAADTASRSNAALVSQSARMMRTLLDELLDLSKIEAGRMGVEALSIDLRQTLLESVRFWRPELRRKGLTLRLRGVRQLPRWVEADPTRLRQILNNLFSNSAKFTERGGLVLAASVEDDAADSVRIVLHLTDTGPGMPEHQVARLFGAFEQLVDSTTRFHGGTGLGLYISRELARLMEGELSATSVLGEGSTFSLSLPFAKAQAPAATLPEPVGETLGGLRLLIVDDHEVNRQAFSLMLQPLADLVISAEDGEQALAVLAMEAFDLVLMDLNMPGMSGLEATLKLKSGPGPNRNTPVIALTGSATPQDLAACRAAGMVAHVSKPVAAGELLAAIGVALDLGMATGDSATRLA